MATCIEDASDLVSMQLKPSNQFRSLLVSDNSFMKILDVKSSRCHFSACFYAHALFFHMHYTLMNKNRGFTWSQISGNLPEASQFLFLQPVWLFQWHNPSNPRNSDNVNTCIKIKHIMKQNWHHLTYEIPDGSTMYSWGPSSSS